MSQFARVCASSRARRRPRARQFERVARRPRARQTHSRLGLSGKQRRPPLSQLLGHPASRPRTTCPTITPPVREPLVPPHAPKPYIVGGGNCIPPRFLFFAKHCVPGTSPELRPSPSLGVLLNMLMMSQLFFSVLFRILQMSRAISVPRFACFTILCRTPCSRN